MNKISGARLVQICKYMSLHILENISEINTFKRFFVKKLQITQSNISNKLNVRKVLRIQRFQDFPYFYIYYFVLYYTVLFDVIGVKLVQRK